MVEDKDADRTGQDAEEGRRGKEKATTPWMAVLKGDGGIGAHQQEDWRQVDDAKGVEAGVKATRERKEKRKN